MTATNPALPRAARPRSPAVLSAALALSLALLLAAPTAHAVSFLDEVDRGKAAVLTGDVGELGGAAGRAAAVQEIVRGDPSPAFAVGAGLAALNLDLESDPGTGRTGDRAIVEQQVRDLLRAQSASGIGNRALCLLSGRSDPRSLEAQVRLVVPGWTCGPKLHTH